MNTMIHPNSTIITILFLTLYVVTVSGSNKKLIRSHSESCLNDIEKQIPLVHNKPGFKNSGLLKRLCTYISILSLTFGGLTLGYQASKVAEQAKPVLESGQLLIDKLNNLTIPDLPGPLPDRPGWFPGRPCECTLETLMLTQQLHNIYNMRAQQLQAHTKNHVEPYGFSTDLAKLLHHLDRVCNTTIGDA